MKLRALALALTVLTGFSGLVYEITWQRYLATLLGSHSEATAAVLGLFLGGLAAGYSLFGAVTRRITAARQQSLGAPHLLVVYGVLELGIGVYALFFPLLFKAVQALSFTLPLAGGGVSFALDVLLSALLVVPPAILMGGTIPMLTQALSHDLEDATRFHAMVYGFNTVGAFAGALMAGYWLVPALGLVGILMVMSAINIFAGVTFVAIGRWAPTEFAQRLEESEAEAGVEGFYVYLAVALLSGFAMMAIQTILIRIGGLSFGSSQFTFSMVVAVFVLCIAVGSLLVSLVPRIPRKLVVVNQWLLFASFFLLYFALQDGPYWAHALRSLFRDNPAGFYPYYISAFAGLLLVIGLPVAFSGASLPLIFDHLRSEVGLLGRAAGRLYSWNTVGSLLGALLGGYALFFWLDLDEVFQVALLALCVGAAALTARVSGAGMRAAGALLLAAALAGVALLPAWEPYRLSSGTFRERKPGPHSFSGPDEYFRERALMSRPFDLKIPFYDDDPTSSVAIRSMKGPEGEYHHSILTNGKSDGSIPDDYVTMSLSVLLPAILAERAERAFIVGYGTGVSAGEFAALDSAREVIVAEISPGVIKAAPYFDPYNLGASENPKVRILRSDAYRALLRSEGGFDVIFSEPSNPWVSGVEMLYSVEFLRAARDRLNPGGIHTQWFYGYETDDATVELILQTYRAAFDHVSVWFTTSSDFLLMGFRDPELALDVERLEMRSTRPDIAAGLARCGIGSFPAVLAHELLPLGVVHEIPLGEEVHTLLHPRLSHVAARAFFAASGGEPPEAASARAGLQSSLLRRYLDRQGDRLSEDIHRQLVLETCRYRARECLTLLAHWKHEAPASEQLKSITASLRNSRRLARPIRSGLVSALAGLYGPVPADLEAGSALQMAERATRNFTSYYHHGVPFPRRTLRELWERCATDGTDGQRCRSERAQAEAALGSL